MSVHKICVGVGASIIAVYLTMQTPICRHFFKQRQSDSASHRTPPTPTPYLYELNEEDLVVPTAWRPNPDEEHVPEQSLVGWPRNQPVGTNPKPGLSCILF